MSEIFIDTHQSLHEAPEHVRWVFEEGGMTAIKPDQLLVGVNALYLHSDENEHFWTILDRSEAREVAYLLLASAGLGDTPPPPATFLERLRFLLFPKKGL